MAANISAALAALGGRDLCACVVEPWVGGSPTDACAALIFDVCAVPFYDPNELKCPLSVEELSVKDPMDAVYTWELLNATAAGCADAPPYFASVDSFAAAVMPRLNLPIFTSVELALAVWLDAEHLHLPPSAHAALLENGVTGGEMTLASTTDLAALALTAPQMSEFLKWRDATYGATCACLHDPWCAYPPPPPLPPLTSTPRYPIRRELTCPRALSLRYTVDVDQDGYVADVTGYTLTRPSELCVAQVQNIAEIYRRDMCGWEGRRSDEIASQARAACVRTVKFKSGVSAYDYSGEYCTDSLQIMSAIGADGRTDLRCHISAIYFGYATRRHISAIPWRRNGGYWPYLFNLWKEWIPPTIEACPDEVPQFCLRRGPRYRRDIAEMEWESFFRRPPPG